MTTNDATHSKAELTQAAVENAMEKEATSLNLDTVGEVEARKLMSAEHKALGYRPPHGSLAAAAQAAAAKHPDPDVHADVETLKKAAISDAAKVSAERGADVPIPEKAVRADLNLNSINTDDARVVMSEEHKALGYRPPPGSLAADAQAAAAKHPNAVGVDHNKLKEAALKDAARIAEQRSAEPGGAHVDPTSVQPDEASKLQSVEHKILGTTKDTLASEAQSAAA